MPVLHPRITPLSGHALLVDWGNRIDPALNDRVQALFHTLSLRFLPGVRDMAPAYSSLALVLDLDYFDRNMPGADPHQIAGAWVEEALQSPLVAGEKEIRVIEIPVCYDIAFAPDLESLADQLGMSTAEVAAIHCERLYRVYMLGFLPGFAYMGPVDKRIEAPRLARPRGKVEAGSVGIAGLQTGIYPVDSPGGWNIIGRTPLRMFDPGRTDPVLLRPGDQVRFREITKEEFLLVKG